MFGELPRTPPRNNLRHLQENNKDSDSPVKEFYAVFIPSESRDFETPDKLIYKERKEALSVIRKYKTARFKGFYDEDSASEFALYGSDFSFEPNGTNLTSPKSTISLRSPKLEEIREVRRAIESGAVGKLFTLINSNPKLLVSSGDTPLIIQEGFRYNALHIAAKSGKAPVCSMILRFVSDLDFIRKLYGEAHLSDGDLKNRSEILMDLYLNTPDKGMFETPLHFASKWGFTEIVKILVSHSACNKEALNKYGQTPFDVICSRSEKVDEVVKKELTGLLKGSYFVPVLRDEDNSTPPSIGDPFSPEVSPERTDSPKSSSPLRIKALAGPMTMEEAEKFKTEWKMKIKTNIYGKTDPDKGLEYTGRNLAAQHSINWSEFWNFLEGFADLKTDDGLHKLECYLAHRHSFYEKSIIELCELLNNAMDFKSKPPYNSKQLNEAGPQASEEIHQTPEKKNGPEGSKLPIFITSLRVYAHRISRHILMSSSNPNKEFDNEIQKLSQFLLSCIKDPKFFDVPFEKVHSIFSIMVLEQLRDKATKYETIPCLMERMFDACFCSYVYDETLKGLKDAIICICRFLYKFVNDSRFNFTQDQKGKFFSNEWYLENAELCMCKFWSPNPSQRRKLGFHHRPIANSDSEDDVSDDDKFSTPPETEDEREAENNSIFILGNKPSKADFEVLDAISHAKISPKMYPFIYQWMQRCNNLKQL